MKTLTVFYDGECGLCHACRQWLSQQAQYLEIRFVAFQSNTAQEILPTLADYQPDRQLVALSDDGGIYLGDDAWIMCFYALVEYREWSQRLASPALRPLAKRLCRLISNNRLALSRFCPNSEVVERLQMLP